MMEKRNWIIWISIIGGCLGLIVGYFSYKDYKYNKVVEDHKRESDLYTAKSNLFSEFLAAHEKNGTGSRMLCNEVERIPFGLIKESYAIDHNPDKNYHIEEITEWKDGKPLTKKWKLTIKEKDGKFCISAITEVR